VNNHEYDSERTLCDKPHPDDKSNIARPKKDNILTVPNLLCVSRIIAAPYLAHLIFQGNFSWAAGIFVYAGFTDLLDGWIARKFPGQASSLGSFLDPLADKILVGTLFLSLTYVNMIPASLTGLVVSRDLFLIYAGLYIRYMSVVPPFTLKKYFDISLPTAQVQPTTISKVNTCLQFLLLATTLGSPLLGYMDHPWLHYLWAATGTTTFLSAVSYAFLKDTYKFSHREYDHQFRKKLTAFILFVLFNVGFTLFFPSQTRLTQSTASECPITGQGSNSKDCPIITEGDLYKDRSMDYYRKKAHSMEEK
jgi:cardiolipin synthase